MLQALLRDIVLIVDTLDQLFILEFELLRVVLFDNLLLSLGFFKLDFLASLLANGLPDILNHSLELREFLIKDLFSVVSMASPFRAVFARNL